MTTVEATVATIPEIYRMMGRKKGKQKYFLSGVERFEDGTVDVKITLGFNGKYKEPADESFFSAFCYVLTCGACSCKPEDPGKTVERDNLVYRVKRVQKYSFNYQSINSGYQKWVDRKEDDGEPTEKDLLLEYK